MNWISMLSPWQWLVMAAIPPLIVMLYFLKLRRQSVQVPSTYLWQRTIEDLHVNSIWQRLRKNLLLLLQLIAVGLLILACLRPGMPSQSELGNRTIFLIDNSASMQATDVDGTRLEQAKKKVLELIEGLEGNDVAMVIAFSNAADVRQGFTGDRRRLRESVASIQPTTRNTDMNEALRAAAGLANPGRTSQLENLADVPVAEARPATLYVVSDGGFPTPQFEMGNLMPNYIPIGTDSGDNVAILAFTTERNAERPDQVEAFARIKNFSSEPKTVTATLTIDNELVDASEVKLEPGGESGATFQLKEVDEGQFKIEIEIEDDLSIDNVAYAGLDPPRELQVVLVTKGDTALQTALATTQAASVASVSIMDPETLSTPEGKALSEGGKVDLFIYDRCSPPTMPQSNTLFLGAIPPGDLWKASPPDGPVFVIDTNRAHPILQYVNMGSLQIVQGSTLQPPQGATELVRSNNGILMAVAPREAYQDAVLGMTLTTTDEKGDTPNTDWPIRPSFPVFWLNALEYLGGAVSTAGSKTVQPSQPATLSLASRHEKVKITDPSGNSKEIDRAGQPQLIYTQTDSPGFYRVTPIDSDRTLQLFTVNMFNDRESSIAITEDIMLGDQQVAATKAEQIVRREFWRWLLAIALVVLTAEWILYTRRVAV